eukprot:gene823-10565_t
MDFLKTPSKTNSAHSKNSDSSNVNKGSATFSIDEDDDISSKNSSQSVKMRKSKSPKTKGKIEDQLNNENLKMLQQIFENADEDCGGGLDIDEFGKALKMAFQQELDDKQLNMLFMKVDTNCDGTVDWEEFCNYMLLENQQKDSMSRDVNELPFPNPDRTITNPHHDILVSVAYLPSFGANHGQNSDEVDSSSGRYLSCSKDGALVFWNLDFKLQKTVLLGDHHSSSNKTRPIWVTCLVALGNVKKIAVSTTERDLSFYDCSGNNFDKQYMVTGFQHSILSMDYWYNPRNLNESLILLGDTGGGVSCIMFKEATVGLFDVNIGKLEVLSHVTFRRISFKELFKKNHRSVKVISLPGLHDDWVRKVKFIPNLQCFLSCTRTNNTSLYLGDLQRKKMNSYFRVRKGIYAFDYDKDNNVIVTGGPDRIIRLWNPYVTTKATSVLKGHVAPICQIIMDSEHQQIISISKDKMIKIWDMRDQLCIQTIPSRLVHIGSTPVTTAHYNPKHMTLVLGGTSLVVLDKRAKIDYAAGDDEVTSHCKPLCAALYNDLFNQVVSACHGSVVNVWQLETGEKSIMFKVADDDVEITSISFDPTMRRLITGTGDGTVRIWNFNNGACLRELQSADGSEEDAIWKTKCGSLNNSVANVATQIKRCIEAAVPS